MEVDLPFEGNDQVEEMLGSDYRLFKKFFLGNTPLKSYNSYRNLDILPFHSSPVDHTDTVQASTMDIATDNDHLVKLESR